MKITSQYRSPLHCFVVRNLVGLGIMSFVCDSLNRHGLYALSSGWSDTARSPGFWFLCSFAGCHPPWHQAGITIAWGTPTPFCWERWVCGSLHHRCICLGVSQGWTPEFPSVPETLKPGHRLVPCHVLSGTAAESHSCSACLWSVHKAKQRLCGLLM